MRKTVILTLALALTVTLRPFSAPVIAGESSIQIYVKRLSDPSIELRRAALKYFRSYPTYAKDGIPALAHIAKEDHRKLSVEAIEILARVGPGGVPALIESLKDTRLDCRLAAINGLRYQGPAAKDAVPLLLPLLKDPNAKVQNAAVGALGAIGPAAEAAVPAVAEFLAPRTLDPALRMAAADALGNMGPKAVALLIQALDDPIPETRAAAAAGLGRLIAASAPNAAAAEPALAVLTKRLTDNRSDVRREAATALGALGPKAADAVPAISELLKDTSTETVKAAVAALGRIGAPALPTLAAKCKDASAETRVLVVESLAKMGLPAFPVLMDALKDSCPEVRQRGADGLQRPGKLEDDLQKSVIAALAVALADESSAVRTKASGALATYAADAWPVTPALIKALQDNCAPVRYRAAETLGRVPVAVPPAGGLDRTCVAPLMTALAQIGPSNGQGAMRALGRLGADAQDAIPLLTAALNDDDVYARAAAAEALAGIIGTLGEKRPDLKATTDALVATLKENDPQLTPAVIEALGKVGPAASAAVPSLVEALKGKPAEVRKRAADALGQVGIGNKEAVAALAAGIKDEYAESRDAAVAALGRMGPPGIEPLIPALKDPRAPTRRLALDGLRRILGLPPSPSPGAAAPSPSGPPPGEPPPLAAPVIPALVALLKDAELAARATETLTALGPAALPNLVAAWKTAGVNERLLILTAASHIVSATPRGRPAEDAVAMFIEALKEEPSGRTHLLALDAIVKAGPIAGPPLLAALKDATPAARGGIARALGKMKPPPLAAIPALIKLLGEEKSDTAASTIAALGAIARECDAANSSAGSAPPARSPFNAAVAALAEALSDPNATVRTGAAQALAAAGAAGKDAVPALARLFKDDDRRVRRYAIRALEQAGPAAVDATPALIEAIQDPANTEREYMLAALTAIGPQAAPALVAALRLESAPVRRDMARVLGTAKPDPAAVLPGLRALLQDSNWEAREGAALALGFMGETAKDAAPLLTPLVKDPRPEVRLAVAWALGHLNPATKETVVPVLVEALTDARPEIRVQAADGIGQFGPAAKSAIPALIEAIRDGDPDSEQAMGAALGKIGADALPAINDAVKHKRPELRRGAIWALRTMALASITPPPAPAPADATKTEAQAEPKISADVLTALNTALKDEDAGVRRAAAAVFRSLGAAARDALPALLAALRDPDDEVRKLAIEVFGQLSPAPDAVAALLEAAKDQNDAVKAAAQAHFRKLPASAASVLIALLKDRHAEARKVIIGSLVRMGSTTPGLVSGLVELLKNDAWEAREGAAFALGAVRPYLKEATPALKAALKDAKVEVHVAAACGLTHVIAHYGRTTTINTKEVLEVLSAALANADAEVRGHAASALRRMGVAAREAVPALLTALKDTDKGVRQLARAALEDMAAADKELGQKLAIALNEMSALESCLMYVEAQDVYYETDWNADGILEYAQALHGDLGLYDGPMKKKRPMAGIFADAAAARGKTAQKEAYRFKILTEQGVNAPGGKKTFMDNGRLVGGHALVAWPVEYGVTGRMTLLVNEAGNVHERDLGPQTGTLAEKITEYDPDPAWTQIGKGSQRKTVRQARGDFDF